jgi:hypothetical protein
MIRLESKSEDVITLHIYQGKLDVQITTANDESSIELEIEEISMLIWQLQLHREILKETKKE